MCHIASIIKMDIEWIENQVSASERSNCKRPIKTFTPSQSSKCGLLWLHKNIIYVSYSSRFDPALTYGVTKKQQVEPFRPHYVIYDKKTLGFMGYFRQHVPESRTEPYRIRYVNIYYYLEDDTMEVFEPFVRVK